MTRSLDELGGGPVAWRVSVHRGAGGGAGGGGRAGGSPG